MRHWVTSPRRRRMPPWQHGDVEALLQGAAPRCTSWITSEGPGAALRTGRLARGGLRIYTTLDLELAADRRGGPAEWRKGIEKKLIGRRKGKGPQRDPTGLEGALWRSSRPPGKSARWSAGWISEEPVQSRRPGAPAARVAFKPSCMRRRSLAGSPRPRLWTIFRQLIPSQERGVRGVEPGEYDGNSRPGHTAPGPGGIHQRATVRLLEAVGVDPVANWRTAWGSSPPPARIRAGARRVRSECPRTDVRLHRLRKRGMRVPPPGSVG